MDQTVRGAVTGADGAESFDDLYRTQYASLVRLAYLLTGSTELAADLVHDACLRVMGRFDDLDNPRAYLRQAVINETKMHWRRRDVETRHAPTAPSPQPPPELDETWDALAHLTPRRRAALVLRFYEDMKVDDIAAALGCRPGTARALIHRGLASMRKELGMNPSKRTTVEDRLRTTLHRVASDLDPGEPPALTPGAVAVTPPPDRRGLRAALGAGLVAACAIVVAVVFLRSAPGERTTTTGSSVPTTATSARLSRYVPAALPRRMVLADLTETVPVGAPGTTPWPRANADATLVYRTDGPDRASVTIDEFDGVTLEEADPTAQEVTTEGFDGLRITGYRVEDGWTGAVWAGRGDTVVRVSSTTLSPEEVPAVAASLRSVTAEQWDALRLQRTSPSFPVPAGIPAETYYRLVGIARRGASEGEGVARRVTAVATTKARADLEVTGMSILGPDVPVWVVVVEGDAPFVCRSCKGPPDGLPVTGRFQFVIVSAEGGQGGGLGDIAPDLGALGDPIVLVG